MNEIYIVMAGEMSGHVHAVALDRAVAEDALARLIEDEEEEQEPDEEPLAKTDLPVQLPDWSPETNGEVVSLWQNDSGTYAVWLEKHVVKRASRSFRSAWSKLGPLRI